MQRFGAANSAHSIERIAASLVDHLPIPRPAYYNDVCDAVSNLHGRRIVFAEMAGDHLLVITGIVFEARTFTGIVTVTGDSNYYTTWTKLHELSHIVVREAPSEWFPPGMERPRPPLPHSTNYLRLCPANSRDAMDADATLEELIVEVMAKLLMMRVSDYRHTQEEEHFG